MNLDKIKRRLPMYVKQEYVRSTYATVKVDTITMGILFREGHKVYFKALCYHKDAEYAKRNKFLSFFIHTKLLTLDNFYRVTIYELHGFKNDHR